MTDSDNLVIGVDFGMTCVAYANRRMESPKMIQKWPGKAGIAQNKVPTTVYYSGSNVKWGFLCEDRSYDGDRREWFKPYIDSAMLERFRQNNPEYSYTSDDVHSWCRDYLKNLYEHIRHQIKKSHGWEDRGIYFTFSIPTTWIALGTVEDFKALIREAGFTNGAKKGRHTIEVGLTEPQAAGVYTLRESLVKLFPKDIILVCDAGGGTTDLALLEITRIHDKFVRLDERLAYQGANIGAVHIDEGFINLVEGRLMAGGIPEAREKAYLTMRNSTSHDLTYEQCKCSFGLPEGDAAEYNIPVPGCERITNKVARITNGKMKFTRDDFKDIFDPLVESIIELIDRQFENMQQRHPSKKMACAISINYIVLSGGLGSSEYLRKALEEKFLDYHHPNASGLKILVSDEPQLSVAKGLVYDRLQRMNTGKSVLGAKASPANYGIVVQKGYNKVKHVGEQVTIDEFSGGKTAKDLIHWFIEKDKPIHENDPDLIHTVCVRRTVTEMEKRRPFSLQVMKYEDDTGSRPTSTKDGRAVHILDVEVQLSQISRSKWTTVNPRFFGFGKGMLHYTLDCEIRAVPGTNDLRFELWYDGENYTNEHSIAMAWKEGAHTSVHPHEDLDTDGLYNKRHSYTLSVH
ncbi:hypothetical protein V8E54_006786 [Elaphomyces granulatus]